MARVEAEAAVASDVTQLMDALPPLANVLRYGNVRKTDTAMVAHAVVGLVARICVGLPLACVVARRRRGRGDVRLDPRASTPRSACSRTPSTGPPGTRRSRRLADSDTASTA